MSESTPDTQLIAKDPKRPEAYREYFDPHARADLSIRLVHMQSCRKCCAPTQIISDTTTWHMTTVLFCLYISLDHVLAGISNSKTI